jgi:hypothetical protein
VTVGREHDKVKPNGEKRTNLRVAPQAGGTRLTRSATVRMVGVGGDSSIRWRAGRDTSGVDECQSNILKVVKVSRTGEDGVTGTPVIGGQAARAGALRRFARRGLAVVEPPVLVG